MVAPQHPLKLLDWEFHVEVHRELDSDGLLGDYHLADDYLRSPGPFTSACRAHLSAVPIRLSRGPLPLEYIDQGEIQFVCSVSGALVQQALTIFV